jgi:NAD(P)-dependent dehydrogenase (short-subunit alcohol dehydrogenase family)
MKLDGRRVLVSWASSGIGEATARVLAERGAGVACLARSKQKVEALAREIGGVAADVADELAVRRAVDEAAEGRGGLDAVANVAGVQLLAPSPTVAPTSGVGYWT